MSGSGPARPSARRKAAVGPLLRRVGRYEVVQPLGRGAMGAVYLARDPQLERTVALKTVWWPEHRGADEEARGELRARFLREARAAAQFVHPNIVTVFDVGEEGEVTFIAMEYVAGRTLADLLADEGGLVEAERAAGMAAQVADALAYAHAKGVVHRDVKPANLLVSADGAVKVADFGIARVPDSTLTLEATVLGTPAYMAPEQIAGRPVDARADLFALGVVLFEMIAGRRPFDGSDLTTLAYQVVHEPHPPLASLRPGLPAAFERVCARALAKEPAARYQAAAEMAADLRALARGRAPADVPGGATLVVGARLAGRPRPAGAGPAAWLGRHGGWLLERLLAKLAAGTAAAAALVLAAGGQGRAAWRAAPPAGRQLVLGAAGGLLAVLLVVWLLSDPVRPARRLLAEGRRSEAIGLLLKLEADDPDQVEVRVLLLEHAESCAVRRRVARRLGEIGDRDALPALEAARRRGLAESLCMGSTLDQAIQRIRGEEPKRVDRRRKSDRAGSAPVGQDPAADVRRFFQKIGEALR